MDQPQEDNSHAESDYIIVSFSCNEQTTKNWTFFFIVGKLCKKADTMDATV